MMQIDVNKTAAKVIGTRAYTFIQPLFGVDTSSYSWVKDFVRDQKLRSEIDQLQAEITKARASLIDKDELRRMVAIRIAEINDMKRKQMVAHLELVQRRQSPLFSEYSLNDIKVLGFQFCPGLIKLEASDLDQIFSELPDGVSQKEIDRTVKKHESEIAARRKTIDEELSPKQRWFYNENGNPLRYPMGCRWKNFVMVWELVAKKFSKPVDIDGMALATSAGHMAYDLLNLGVLPKWEPTLAPKRVDA